MAVKKRKVYKKAGGALTDPKDKLLKEHKRSIDFARSNPDIVSNRRDITREDYMRSLDSTLPYEQLHPVFATDPQGAGKNVRNLFETNPLLRSLSLATLNPSKSKKRLIGVNQDGSGDGSDAFIDFQFDTPPNPPKLGKVKTLGASIPALSEKPININAPAQPVKQRTLSGKRTKISNFGTSSEFGAGRNLRTPRGQREQREFIGGGQLLNGLTAGGAGGELLNFADAGASAGGGGFDISGAAFSAAGDIASGAVDFLSPHDEYGVQKKGASIAGGALGGAGKGAGVGTMILPGIGTAVGAGIGAIGGAIRGGAETKAEEEQKAKFLSAKTKYLRGQGNAKLLNETTSEASGFKRNGGPLNAISSDAVEVNGPSHELGGVPLNSMNAEVEGGETIGTVDNEPYVFSEYLGFSKPHKKLMKSKGAIEKRGKSRTLSPTEKNTLSLLSKRETELRDEQESVRTAIDEGVKSEFRTGGKLNKYIGGGNIRDRSYRQDDTPLEYKFETPAQDTSFYTSDAPQYDFAQTDKNLFGKAPSTFSRLTGQKLGGEDVSGNPTILDVPNSGGGGFDMEGGRSLNDLLPYASNIVNSFRRLPQVPDVSLESTVAPNLVNLDAAKEDIKQQRRSTNLAINRGVNNSTVAQALNATTLGTATTALNEVNSKEANINADIKNKTAITNQFIGARNTERLNKFREDITSRRLAQQRLASENISNFSEKAQVQLRDQKLDALEVTKALISNRAYGESGVTERKLKDYLDQLRTKKPKNGFRIRQRSTR